FMGWDGPILTDSGGYQIFSLAAKVTEEGVAFKSTYDGTPVLLTPEEATRVQELLGPDVAMVLDELIGLPAPREWSKAAMERTLRWAERAIAAHSRTDQVQFGIVQGGVDLDLRAESARATAQLGFKGIALGGLSVGESPTERNQAIEASVAELPDDRVRYVMGLGDAEGVLDAVARGCDLFDCVWPTRLARHGKAITSSGDFNIRQAAFMDDAAPLDASCDCATCARYSRAYLNHHVRAKELSAHRLLSIHNLTYTLSLLDGARTAIAEGRLTEYRAEVAAGRVQGVSTPSP
ncbi:MAG: tRNA guanosine(34) transglycosylase Tgt, partial [Acidimicrobiia bacterium]|nr:tRNA guanosine(34) transglycosylase Tgt [Acidimicrobiia bacterium]